MAYSSYIQAFVDRVLNYTGRDASVFTPSSVDNCLAAINDSRQQALQAATWEGLKTKGFMYFSPTTDVHWAYATGTYGPYTAPSTGGGSTKLRIRSIDMLFNYTTDTTGGYQPTNRVLLQSTQDFRGLLPVNMGFPFLQTFPSTPPYYYNTIPTQQMFAYILGPHIKLNTCTTNSWLMFFGQQSLIDLTGNETSDFFIDNYQRWLLLATIQNLNGYLKEDQRIAITAAEVNNAWDRAVFDDAKKGYQGDDWVTLD
jgi:hypothetical protein